jgi:hypothetical protein
MIVELILDSITKQCHIRVQVSSLQRTDIYLVNYLIFID